MADFGWAYVKGGLLSGSAPPDKSVQFNAGSGQLGGSADLTFDSGSSTLTLSGTLNISGAINTNELNVNVTNHNVTNISATGSTKFGDTVDDLHIFTGSLEISTSANPLKLQGLQLGAPANLSSYVVMDSNYNLVLTSAVGTAQGGTIGAAEDGDYTDGLFEDFVSSTPIGTAVDRFNEILKLIVPSPAPNVDRINYINATGIDTNLSFGTSNAITDYVDVGAVGSLTAKDINELYASQNVDEDYRLGVYNGSQEITGVINFQVSENYKGSYLNFSNNSFGNGDVGTLKLILNGTVLHSIDLSSFVGAGNPNSGSASSFSANGSGFFEVSIAKSATDQTGTSFDIFKHRSAKFVIDPLDQNKGWNYAKVEHQNGSTTYVANYVEWVNDTDSSLYPIGINSSVLNVVGGGSKYLSGVQYFTGSTATLTCKLENLYHNTYPTGNVITFGTTRLNSVSPQSIPIIGIGEDETKELAVTASTTTSTNLLNQDVRMTISATHPFKSAFNSTELIQYNLLVYNNNTANSNTTENFELENYRLINGTYNLQSDVLSAGSWNSQNHMTSSGASGYTDGLLFYNSKLHSPKSGANSGNFAGIANGPTGNPNYSGVTGTRTFFRKIQNTTGASVRDIKITSTKNTAISFGTLGSGNIHFYIKVPGTTGWMDISKEFSYGLITDGYGALIPGADDNVNTGLSDTGNSVHCVTFGTASVANNDYVVIKIEADASWTSYIETLQFQLNASDIVQTLYDSNYINNIDVINTGVAAKLSFGTSNPISGFSSATSSVISRTDYDSNDLFSISSDVRGVFKQLNTYFSGTLNQSTTANLPSYTADSFRAGNTGSLIIEVNGSEVHSVDLASSYSSIDSRTLETGFILSAVQYAETSDGIPDYRRPYRTGTYQIGYLTIGVGYGWNYARIIHRISGLADKVTNYFEWIVDNTSYASTSVADVYLDDTFEEANTYSQSGVKYFVSSPSGAISFKGVRVYENVYSPNANAISLGTLSNGVVSQFHLSGAGVVETTNITSNPYTSLPNLNNQPNCETEFLDVTASITYNGGTSIPDSLGLFSTRRISLTSSIANPIRTSTTQTFSSDIFLVHSGTLNSSTLNSTERFGFETYRLVSGNYASQSDLTSSSNSWDSTITMNNAPTYPNYYRGALTVNGYMFSPTKIGISGDLTSFIGPLSNVNYSSLSGQITYYRLFKNTGLSATSTPTITLYGDANLISKSGAFYTGTLGANKNIQVELKVSYDPNFTGLDDTSTAWGDCIRPYESGTQPTTDGVGIYSGGGSDLNQTVNGSGRSIPLQLQQSQIRSNQYFVVKITAHTSWTGYLSRIDLSY